MVSKSRVLPAMLAALLLLSNGACSSKDLSRLLGQEPPSQAAAGDGVPTAEGAGIQNARLDYSPERIQELEVIAQGSPSSRARADAHYFLGWIFAYEGNPKRDYDRALKEFETYLGLAEREQVRADASSWVRVLKELKQQREEGGKQKALNAQLEKRILEMEQDIQKLKELDLWLENQKQDRR